MGVYVCVLCHSVCAHAIWTCMIYAYTAGVCACVCVCVCVYVGVFGTVYTYGCVCV